jgi:hypothetical protein
MTEIFINTIVAALWLIGAFVTSWALYSSFKHGGKG